MTDNNKPRLTFSRPENNSFEAYKEWILGLCKELGAKGTTPSDEEIRADWVEFWSE